MDYTQFLFMKEELSLVVIIVVLLIADLLVGSDSSDDTDRIKLNTLLPVSLIGIHTLLFIIPGEANQAFGGMYHYVPAMGILKTLLNISTLVLFLMSHEWLNRKDTVIKRGEFYILTLCTLLGMYLMTSSGHFLLFFIGLELASLPIAILVSFDKYHSYSAEAGAKFILMALFSSGLLLYGLSLIYGAVGTLYFHDVASLLTGSAIQVAGLVLFFVGLAFKISLVPFHQWTPDVYEGAPIVVTGYLSTLSKGASAFSLLIILWLVFGSMLSHWQTILFGVIIATITVGNLFAIRQRNLKRFMAFSSISQAGYILLGIIGGNATGMTSMLYYILVYSLSTLALFIIIGLIEENCGKTNIEDYNGMYQSNPKLVFLMTLALFSLAGIPPLAGFFSKFFIFMAAFEAGFHLLVFIALINTVLSLYYYLLLVKAMYITPNETPIATFHSNRYSQAGLTICVLGILLLGLVSTVYQTMDKYSFGM